MAHVESLIKAGIPAASIGIITPYNAQVALLKEIRAERLSGVLEVSSVDGFQVATDSLRLGTHGLISRHPWCLSSQ